MFCNNGWKLVFTYKILKLAMLEDLRNKLVGQISELGSTKGKEKEKTPIIILKLTRTFVGC
jgi:hypothetical protein